MARVSALAHALARPQRQAVGYGVGGGRALPPQASPYAVAGGVPRMTPTMPSQRPTNAVQGMGSVGAQPATMPTPSTGLRTMFSPSAGMATSSAMGSPVQPQPTPMRTMTAPSTGDAPSTTTSPSSYGGRGAVEFGPPSAPTDAQGRPMGPPLPGLPWSPGTDPYGYPYDVKGKKKFKGNRYGRKMKNAPPWLQDPRMFEQSTGQILDLLMGRGQRDPAALMREQADIESGRGQSQQALQARLAAAGVDPSSPMYQSMAGTVDQGANRMQFEARRQEDIDAYNRQRENLNLVMPYLQYIFGLTAPKSRSGGPQAVNVGGGGGGGTDWAGILSSAGNAVLSNYQNMPWVDK